VNLAFLYWLVSGWEVPMLVTVLILMTLLTLKVPSDLLTPIPLVTLISLIGYTRCGDQCRVWFRG
jgi:hypothetical protein